MPTPTTMGNPKTTTSTTGHTKIMQFIGIMSRPSSTIQPVQMNIYQSNTYTKDMQLKFLQFKTQLFMVIQFASLFCSCRNSFREQLMIQDQLGPGWLGEIGEDFFRWDLDPVCLQYYGMDRVGAQLKAPLYKGIGRVFKIFQKGTGSSEFSHKK